MGQHMNNPDHTDHTIQTGPEAPGIRARRRFWRGLTRRFVRNQSGVVAIEYAILALPFFLIVFAIIETGVRYTAQQLLSNSSETIARQFRTGVLIADDITPNQVRDAICTSMEILVKTGCPDLLVDLQHYTTFADVPTQLPLKADGDINSTGFKIDPGERLTINQLRVFYRWPVMTDIMRDRLSSMPNGKTLLFSTITWQNEPY